MRYAKAMKQIQSWNFSPKTHLLFSLWANNSGWRLCFDRFLRTSRFTWHFSRIYHSAVDVQKVGFLHRRTRPSCVQGNWITEHKSFSTRKWMQKSKLHCCLILCKAATLAEVNMLHLTSCVEYGSRTLAHWLLAHRTFAHLDICPPGLKPTLNISPPVNISMSGALCKLFHPIFALAWY